MKIFMCLENFVEFYIKFLEFYIKFLEFYEKEIILAKYFPIY